MPEGEPRGRGDPMISLSVSMIWLLAMLGAASHLRDSGRNWGNAAFALAIFAGTMAVAGWLSPQPNWVSVLIGVAAVWRLIAGASPKAGLALAGASAGLAAALVAAGGVSVWLSAGLSGGALAAAFALRGAKRPSGTRQEVLLVFIGLATPLIGLAGDLVFGWHSAAMLSREAVELKAAAPPIWAIAIVGAALLAGLVRGLWIRR